MGTANARLTYSVQRQESTSVRPPSQQQPDRRARDRDGTEDAEGLAALHGPGEGRGQQRESRWGEQRPEAPLDRSGDDEHPEGLCGAAEGRRRCEPDQAGEQRPLRTEQISETTTEQQQGAEGERVGGHDPFPRRVGEAEVALHGGEGDIND